MAVAIRQSDSVVDEALLWASQFDPTWYAILVIMGVEIHSGLIRAAASFRVVNTLCHFLKVSTTNVAGTYDHSLLKPRLEEKGEPAVRALALKVYHRLLGDSRTTWESEFEEISSGPAPAEDDASGPRGGSPRNSVPYTADLHIYQAA